MASEQSPGAPGISDEPGGDGKRRQTEEDPEEKDEEVDAPRFHDFLRRPSLLEAIATGGLASPTAPSRGVDSPTEERRDAGEGLWPRDEGGASDGGTTSGVSVRGMQFLCSIHQEGANAQERGGAGRRWGQGRVYTG